MIGDGVRGCAVSAKLEAEVLRCRRVSSLRPSLFFVGEGDFEVRVHMYDGSVVFVVSDLSAMPFDACVAPKSWVAVL